MTKFLIIAAMATASFSQAATAQSAPASPTVIVQQSDLDLRTEAGAQTLKHRIRHAVNKVCGSAPDFDLKGKNDVKKCRAETHQMALAQANHAIASATRNQPIRVNAAAN